MDLDWDDLKTVLCLVRAGSLSRAADALEVSYTTVSRRVRNAEEKLGKTLFERLADGYHPTADAQLIAEHAQHMERAADEMMRKLQGRDTTLSGSLTFTAPQLLIAPPVTDAIKAFRAAHPDVDLQILGTNSLLDLNRREADLAIRISDSPGDSLKGLRLAEQQAGSFASHELARKLREVPDAPMDWLAFDGFDALEAQILESHPNARIALRFDDVVSMLGAAVAGLGVVKLPYFLGRSWPGLEEVGLTDPAPFPDIWLVGHPDVWPSAKVTAFRTELVAQFRAIRSQFHA
ncbi:LysR family transcriptional regulator [Roseobacteraceae bacterium S113]